MMKSLWKQNKRQLLDQLDTDTKKLESALVFKQMRLNNNLLPIYIYIYIYIYVCVCVCVCEEKLTSNSNRKWRFIEKQSRHYSVSVLLNRHQDYEGYISDVKYRWMYKKYKNI